MCPAPARPVGTCGCWLGPTCRISALSTVPVVPLPVLQFSLRQPHHNFGSCRKSVNCGNSRLSGSIRWQIKRWLKTISASGDFSGGTCRLNVHYDSSMLELLVGLYFIYRKASIWNIFFVAMAVRRATSVMTPATRLFVWLCVRLYVLCTYRTE